MFSTIPLCQQDSENVHKKMHESDSNLTSISNNIGYSGPRRVPYLQRLFRSTKSALSPEVIPVQEECPISRAEEAVKKPDLYTDIRYFGVSLLLAYLQVNNTYLQHCLAEWLINAYY